MNEFISEEEQVKKTIKKIVTILVIGFLGMFLLLTSITYVQAGHVGIVTRFGAVKRVVDPGLVIKIPLAEKVVKMETRVQKNESSAKAASKDLQDVGSVIAINYRIDAKQALDVYQNVGVDYRERLIDPALQEAFKAVTARYTAEELITNRSNVKNEALTHIKERLEARHIIVDDLNIVNFNFSASFNAAIEEKQVAQQNVEREKQNLARIKVEADQARQQAQGQADAQRILQDSGSLSASYLEYLAVQKWDGVMPKATGGVTPFVNID